MKISIFSIEKNSDIQIKKTIDSYTKMSRHYAIIEDRVLFDKTIIKAQIAGLKETQNAYTKLFLPYMANSFNIGMDVVGEEIDSFEFAKILQNNAKINFFIGGAYGLEENFLSKTQKNISLSRLTYAHKIAKIVLYEQIYRGLCINNNHPYHK